MARTGADVAGALNFYRNRVPEDQWIYEKINPIWDICKETQSLWWGGGGGEKGNLDFSKNCGQTQPEYPIVLYFIVCCTSEALAKLELLMRRTKLS